MGLSELASEFRLLEAARRQRGLSPHEAERYSSLFERLEEALTAVERRRPVNTRQFLRVPSELSLMIRRPDGVVAVRCLDFGGGGCAVELPAGFQPAVNDDVWLDGAQLEGAAYPLRGRAQVVWRHDNGRYGLRFAIDSDEMRDQIDRLLYRVLDRFLDLPGRGAKGAKVAAGMATPAL